MAELEVGMRVMISESTPEFEGQWGEVVGISSPTGNMIEVDIPSVRKAWFGVDCLLLPKSCPKCDEGYLNSDDYLCSKCRYGI